MFLNGLAASEPDAKTEQGDSQAAFSKHHDALHESFSPCHSWKLTTQQIFSFMIYPVYTLYTPSCSIGGVGIIFHHCKVDLWTTRSSSGSMCLEVILVGAIPTHMKNKNS